MEPPEGCWEVSRELPATFREAAEKFPGSCRGVTGSCREVPHELPGSYWGVPERLAGSSWRAAGHGWAVAEGLPRSCQEVARELPGSCWGLAGEFRRKSRGVAMGILGIAGLVRAIAWEFPEGRPGNSPPTQQLKLTISPAVAAF